MINIPSIIHYMKLKWIKRVHDKPNGSWQKFLSIVFNIKTDLEGIWLFNKDKLTELRKRITNQFWKDVLDSLILIKKDKLNISEYLQQDIRNFCHISEYDYYTKWCQNNVNCLK